jgi:addiction module HigA family antidote
LNIRVEDLNQMDFSDVAEGGKLPPVTPGEILLEDFLKPMGLTQYRLAKEIGVPQRRIGEIIAGKRAITIDTGLRLARFFGMSDGFWIGLQTDYDTAIAKNALADVLARIHCFKPGSGNQQLTQIASRQQP